jgi:hypothetical protein
MSRGPARPSGHGDAWDQLEACQEQIAQQVKSGLSVVKIGVLLQRQGVGVPYRALHRFCVERAGSGRPPRRSASPTASRGAESQVDSGYLGMMADPVAGRRRMFHALIFTAVYPRHMFVWRAPPAARASYGAGPHRRQRVLRAARTQHPEDLRRNALRHRRSGGNPPCLHIAIKVAGHVGATRRHRSAVSHDFARTPP